MILIGTNRAMEIEMQLRPFTASVLGFALMSACTSNWPQATVPQVEASATEEAQILAVLNAQQAAWNNGDIDGFMDGYWQSPDLRFASGGTVTHGWQATKDGYHARYSNRAAMGVLAFSDLEAALLGSDHAIVHGGWALQRAEDRPYGLFTLVLRKSGDEWLIVSDTTTSGDPS